MSKEFNAEARELRGRINAEVNHLTEAAMVAVKERDEKIAALDRQVVKLAHAYTLMNEAIKVAIDSGECGEGLQRYLRNALDTAYKVNS